MVHIFHVTLWVNHHILQWWSCATSLSINSRVIAIKYKYYTSSSMTEWFGYFRMKVIWCKSIWHVEWLIVFLSPPIQIFSLAQNLKIEVLKIILMLEGESQKITHWYRWQMSIAFIKKYASFIALLVTVNSPNWFISVTSWQHLADVLVIHLQRSWLMFSSVLVLFWLIIFDWFSVKN